MVEQGSGNEERLVFAHITPIAGTPWLLVSTLDQAEIYDSLESGAWTIGVATAVLLILLHLACLTTTSDRR
jgi:hypothetical protein